MTYFDIYYTEDGADPITADHLNVEPENDGDRLCVTIKQDIHRTAVYLTKSQARDLSQVLEDFSGLTSRRYIVDPDGNRKNKD